MKLGCKLINGDGDLWCRVLRGKYKLDGVSNNLEAKSYDSKLWKAIVSTYPTLMEASIWNVGNGNSIHAWDDNWISRGKNISENLISIPLSLRDAKVSDIVGYNGDWDWELLVWLPNDFKL
ncbi:unnamed protein product [Vicia faba]|uniref:Uncharacterized protein n=1 Tax=Vicia faba TaxID=3906 RepID=A0AAV1BE30_VICFA|nr:unnamed protein product [Vicia faba]